ncbi:hypothetical protein GQX74_003250 [Glossina fuscipes]|nr:hypothetical protein GQX74_003250 [Glossina fuscipes]
MDQFLVSTMIPVKVYCVCYRNGCFLSAENLAAVYSRDSCASLNYFREIILKSLPQTVCTPLGKSWILQYVLTIQNRLRAVVRKIDLPSNQQKSSPMPGLKCLAICESCIVLTKYLSIKANAIRDLLLDFTSNKSHSQNRSFFRSTYLFLHPNS